VPTLARASKGRAQRAGTWRAWHVKDAASWHLSAQARGKTLRKIDNFAEDWMIK